MFRLHFPPILDFEGGQKPAALLEIAEVSLHGMGTEALLQIRVNRKGLDFFTQRPGYAGGALVFHPYQANFFGNIGNKKDSTPN